MHTTGPGLSPRSWPLRGPSVRAVLLVPALLAGVSTLSAASSGPWSRPPAVPKLAAAPSARGPALTGSPTPAGGGLPDGRYEYMVTDAGVTIYSQATQAQVGTISLPLSAGVRGVSANAPTHALYVSYGGDGGANGTSGHLLRYDLLTGQIVYTQDYPFGIDHMDITQDGKTIYMPTGELSTGGTWEIIDAATGKPTGTVQGGKGPHNTVVSADGKFVYLGGRKSNFLDVVSTATNTVVKKILNLVNTVRPLTVNGKDTLSFTTATQFLGFQVEDVVNQKVLYTVQIPGTFSTSPSAPSHGISLSPDERELYVMDSPDDRVHVFDVSGLPATAPKEVAAIALKGNFSGKETPCKYDCAKDGWIGHSRDGKLVYVGDAGDVINTATRTTMTVLPTLANTRKYLEIDWSGGVPVLTTPQEGIGYVT
jgi:hypothetical protein